jgi:hypothetical protein
MDDEPTPHHHNDSTSCDGRAASSAQSTPDTHNKEQEMTEQDLFPSSTTVVDDDTQPQEATQEGQEDAFMLTPDSYHSNEANRRYMSHSQYKRWLQCAAKTYAVLNGDFVEEEKDVFVAGRYAHVAILEPEKLDAFVDDNPQILKRIEPTTKELKAFAAEEGIDLKGAMSSKDSIVARIVENGKEPPPSRVEFATGFKWLPGALETFNKQPIYKDIVSRGEHEVILVFELGGVEWKCMIDNLRVEDSQFDDLKFMADFSEKWSSERRAYVHWFEAYDYDQQAAVYRHATGALYGSPFRPNILGVSKQDPADVAWIQFKHTEYLDGMVAQIAANMPRIAEWKAGEVEPPRCERADCDYCRATKVLTRPFIPVPRA